MSHSFESMDDFLARIARLKSDLAAAQETQRCCIAVGLMSPEEYENAIAAALRYAQALLTLTNAELRLIADGLSRYESDHPAIMDIQDMLKEIQRFTMQEAAEHYSKQN